MIRSALGSSVADVVTLELHDGTTALGDNIEQRKLKLYR
jgi:hypothetical protein